MTTLNRCRVPALVVLVPTLLAGCGGVSSIGEDIGNGIVCGLRNCTESAQLNLDEISPRFTATQTAGDDSVVITGSLGKSANLLTTVLMAPDESLRASVDGRPEVAMSNPDGQRWDYVLRQPTSSARPVVRVVFTRGGTRHVSEVTLPPGFAVLQPTGTSLLARSGAALSVRLSQSMVATAYPTASGTCSRSDGSSFALDGTALTALPEGSVLGGYRLDPATVDANLTERSRSLNNNDTRTPAVTRCDMVVTWTQELIGTTPATMNRHGVIRGRRTATHGLSYDARL
jgi:predicted small secreted protein